MAMACIATAVLYGLAWWLSLRGTGAADMVVRDRLASRLQFAGLIMHLLSLFAAISLAGGPRLGFASILSGALWVGVVLLWYEGLRAHVRALRVLVLPLAGVLALLPWMFPGVKITGGGPMFVPHVLVGTLAYAVLFVAAVHAGLMAAAERALHGAPPERPTLLARFLDDLPPLMLLERMLFQFIAIGFGLLSLTLLSGFVFSEEIFGRAFRFEHKTVFAIIAWCVFAILLAGRLLGGWRGRLALRLTFGGFGVLMLAYVGTRFVAEVLLGRV